MLIIEKIQNEGPALETIRRLFQEYADELNENLCFQSFEEELTSPLKKYGPPNACILLAFYNNEPAGCIALQPLKEPGVCEMKRLYVRPAFRKHGTGNELVKRLLEEARNAGYDKMVLDTLQRLQPAIKLYRLHGFKNTSAYYKNPLSEVVYMEKTLHS